MAPYFYRFAIALGIGILVGLQREASYKETEGELFAGVRTFALISLAGYVAALTAEQLASFWPFLGIFAIFGALVAMSYRVDVARGRPGMTTEMATLVVFVTGAMCYWDLLPLAAALAVAVTLMLSLKPQLQAFAHALTRDDIYATLKFAVVSVIILPVLPNQTFGPPPFDVLNPHKIWLMVVFISGISFLGYVLIKTAGARRGIGLTGLLGGIASSTAVTFSFAARSHADQKLARPFASAILVAWTVMFLRVAVIIFALNQSLALRLTPPILLPTLAGLLYCAYLYFAHRADVKEGIQFVNPFDLGPAIKFGLIYALVLLVSKGAQVYFGDTGIYISSLISGVADMDAIVLSVVDLVKTGGLDLPVAARAVVLAMLASTMFKGGFALTSGSPALRKFLWPGLLLMVMAGVGGMFLV